MKNNGEHTDYSALTGRYLANEATKEEVALIEKWVLSNEQNKKLFNQYRQAWILAQTGKPVVDVDIDKEWNKLENILFAEEETGTGKVLTLQPKKSFTHFLKIAAIVLIALTASFFLYRIIAKPGVENVIAMESVKSATLPDGTVIALNKNSVITYPDKFGRKKRKVLLKGEAFFQVKRDEKKPFIIEAENVEIEVLGTSFNVDARPDKQFVEVIVNTGKVALRSEKGKEIVLLKGERGIFSKETGELVKEANKSKNYLAWKTKKLIFEDDCLADVVKDISEVYDINIVLSSPALKDCRLTAIYDNLSLDAILNILKETFDLSVVKKDNIILVTGEGCGG
jgi:ferric-dicitrate binding protein FerR (iron transport regulator)